MRLPEILVGSDEPVTSEPPAVVRRRRLVVAATLAVGAALLAATVATPQGSMAFYALALLVAATWLAGSLASGPLHLGRRGGRTDERRQLLAPALVGIAAFAGFAAASLIAKRLPWLSGPLDSVLERADAGSIALVVVVALVNGAAEEVFFRGALFSALGSRRAAPGSTIGYALVTAATLNAALVIAAVVMGAVLCAERRSTHGVLAPIVTHLVWSTLILLALPR
jgi:hypothetical protein